MSLCLEVINSNDEFKCEKCNYIFKNKHTLNIHKYTSEKCSITLDSINGESKNCFYCNKSFSSKQMKKYHENKCASKIIYNITKEFETEVHNLKKEILYLNSKLNK